MRVMQMEVIRKNQKQKRTSSKLWTLQSRQLLHQS